MAKQLIEFKKQQEKISNKRIKMNDYPQDLTLVAEGDSWFDYPLRKDIIDYLRKKGYAIKCFAKAGDTLENMVFGSQYEKIGDEAKHLGAKSLTKTLATVKKIKPKFFLLSAGGNDIVGEAIIGYLNHKHSNPKSLVNKEIFNARLKQMKLTIEFFIKSIHAKNKKCHILMDGYDYAKVNGTGYEFLFFKVKGPWLLPSMGKKAITVKDDQKAILKYLVDGFNEMLKELESEFDYFHYIDLRGKFPLEKEWDNEIHLKNKGYKKVAEIYHERMTSILNVNPIDKFRSKIIATMS